MVKKKMPNITHPKADTPRSEILNFLQLELYSVLHRIMLELREKGIDAELTPKNPNEIMLATSIKLSGRKRHNLPEYSLTFQHETTLPGGFVLGVFDNSNKATEFPEPLSEFIVLEPAQIGGADKKFPSVNVTHLLEKFQSRFK